MNMIPLPLRVALVCPLVILATSAAFARDIPVEVLFKKADLSQFQVSPNGKYLAALAPFDRRMNLHVVDLDVLISKGKLEIKRVTTVKERDIFQYFWASDDRLIFFMDKDGNESFGMFAINRDGTRPRTLAEPIEETGTQFVGRLTRPLDRLKEEDDFILVTNNDRRLEFPDVFKMNIQTGGKKILLQNPGNVTGWVTDQQGVVRLAATVDPKDETRTGFSYIFRESESEEWQNLGEFTVDNPSWDPLGFSYDGQTLYVGSTLGQSQAGLYTYDLKTRKIGERIFLDPEFDAAGVILSDYRKTIIGYELERAKPEVVWLDEEKIMVQEAIDKAFPDTFNAISSMSEDESVMVVVSTSDRHPAFYNLVKFMDDGSLKVVPLGNSRPWIDPDQMAPMEPFVITARDGVKLHGYITFPAGVERKNLPMVLHPHGGPNARDSWGWNPEVQFLANRGFIVLQVNFRGSTGYGREFVKIANGKWGDEMQWDLLDAVDWAVKNGWADPTRVGVYGASYGGYCVMSQLTQWPERYQWGINYVGVVDLFDMLDYYDDFNEAATAFWKRRFGDPKKDPEKLTRHSPIFHVERIDDPLFIVHGNRDPRVPVDQARKLRGQMEKHKKPFEWMLRADEGHGFLKEENQFALYKALDEFIRPFRDARTLTAGVDRPGGK